MNILFNLQTFICRACFYQILAWMLEACRKSAWNLRNNFKMPNYCPFIDCVRSYYNLFKSPSRNYSLFCREKEEVLINIWMQTGFNRKTFYFESIDADTSLFRLSLAFYFTISWCRLALNFFTWSPANLWGKVCSPDRDAGKPRARNVPLASADICERERLCDRSKEYLCRRLWSRGS